MKTTLIKASDSKGYQLTAVYDDQASNVTVTVISLDGTQSYVKTFQANRFGSRDVDTHVAYEMADDCIRHIEMGKNYN